MINYDEIIIKKIRKIRNKKDVPVVSVIYNSKKPKEYYINSNTREKKKNITGHAEINCINKVFKTKKHKNLSDYILVSSLLPCEMCYFVSKECYLDKIYYYLDNNNNNTLSLNNNTKNKINITKINNTAFENEYKIILKNFFNKMR